MKKYEEKKKISYTLQENKIYPFYDYNIDSLTSKENKKISRNNKIVFNYYITHMIYMIYRNHNIF